MLCTGQYFSKYTYRIFKNLEERRISSTPNVKIDCTLKYVIRFKIPDSELMRIVDERTFIEYR